MVRSLKEPVMIQHVVLMKWNPQVTPEQIDALEALLDRLPNTIIEIQAYEFGRDVARDERSYDFGLVSLFANLEAVGRYRRHPDHLVVATRLKEMCSDLVSVDFELPPPRK
jgi:hypothetical protein